MTSRFRQEPREPGEAVARDPARVPDGEGDPSVLTSGDVARLLSVDLKAVHNWARGGHLEGLKTAGGHLRFHRAEVMRFLRRLGVLIPATFAGRLERIALVGACWTAARSTPGGNVRGSPFALLFDAALAVADGSYELIAVDLDAIPLADVLEFVRALRRRDVTRAIVVVGVGRDPGIREAFVRGGGDIAVADPAGFERACVFYTGA